MLLVVKKCIKVEALPIFCLQNSINVDNNIYTKNKQANQTFASIRITALKKRVNIFAYN